MNVLGNVRQAVNSAGLKRRNTALWFGFLLMVTSGQSGDCMKCPLASALGNVRGVIEKAYFLSVVTRRIEILSGYLAYRYQYRQFDLQ